MRTGIGIIDPADQPAASAGQRRSAPSP